MAILKHIAIKNMDYGEAQRYLLFQHDEHTKKPILDENGEKTQPVTTAYMMLSNHDGLVRLLSIWKKLLSKALILSSRMTACSSRLSRKLQKSKL